MFIGSIPLTWVRAATTSSPFANYHGQSGEFFFKDRNTIISVRDYLEDTFTVVPNDQLPSQIPRDDFAYVYQSSKTYKGISNPNLYQTNTPEHIYIRVSKITPENGSLFTISGNTTVPEPNGSITVVSNNHTYGPYPAQQVPFYVALLFSEDQFSQITGAQPALLNSAFNQIVGSKKNTFTLTNNTDPLEAWTQPDTNWNWSTRDIQLGGAKYKYSTAQFNGSVLLRAGDSYTLSYYNDVDNTTNIFKAMTGGSRIETTGNVQFTIEKDGKVSITGDDASKYSTINGKVYWTSLSSIPDSYFFVPVTFAEYDAVTQVMVKTIGILVHSIDQWISKVGTWINYVLLKGNDIDQQPLKDAWKNILNITLSLLTLALLIIAFANILNLDEKLGYGLNRMIPKIIVSILLAYFSFLIARFLLDLTNAFQAQLLNLPGMSPTQGSSIIGTPLAVNGVNSIAINASSMGMVIFLLILMIFVFLTGLWLTVVLVTRIAVIWVLVALAPMAMLMNIMPFTEGFYKKWWAEWWKWLFMGPAVALFLYFASVSLNSFQTAFVTSGNGWMLLILTAVSLFLAGTVPLTMGGTIMKQVQGAIKKSGASISKQTGATDYIAARKAAIAARPKAKAANMQANLAQRGRLGRFAAGVDKKGANALRQSIVTEAEKTLGARSMDDIKTIALKTGVEAEAAQNLLAKAGQLDNSDYQFATRMAERAQSDKSFSDLIQANQKDYYAGAATAMHGIRGAGYIPAAGSLDAMIKENADRSLDGNISDYGKDTYRYMAMHRQDVLRATVANEGALKKIADTGKPKIMASFGRAIETVNTTPGQAPITNPHLAGTDGNKVFKAAYDAPGNGPATGGAVQDWRNTHNGGDVF